MKYKGEHIAVDDFKAEVIIPLFHDLGTPLHVISKGSFYRNISEDILGMELSPQNLFSELFLSRDGLYHLLPENLFFNENRLLGLKGEAYKKALKEQQKEKERLEIFFQPFDTWYFELGLVAEEILRDIQFMENDILVDYLFELDKQKITEPNKRLLVSLLPYISEIRGDMPLIQKILEAIFEIRVEITTIRMSHHRNGEITHSYPVLKFVFHIPGLSATQYRERMEELGIFFDFFSEYFLPFDMPFVYRVKDKTQYFTTEQALVLDYNTQLL